MRWITFTDYTNGDKVQVGFRYPANEDGPERIKIELSYKYNANVSSETVVIPLRVARRLHTVLSDMLDTDKRLRASYGEGDE